MNKDNPTYISNENIVRNISDYYSIYHEYGSVTFELTEEQDDALKSLVNRYRLDKEEKEFDMSTWSYQVAREGLMDNSEAFHIFGFILSEWNSSIGIRSYKYEATCLIDVYKRSK